ncbi:hypothetical protein EVAR_56_1 [Eumeta japonica]|uniref:Uncharacterized protein n=1 Tax=Eumeta variegata TaxID=151549 RepID=A0A4C1SB37_EUMVA|nr:hypothetical protein EVAR_56_1 [Eumeta japonica]
MLESRVLAQVKARSVLKAERHKGLYNYHHDKKRDSTVWCFENEPTPTNVAVRAATGKNRRYIFFCETVHIATLVLEDKQKIGSHDPGLALSFNLGSTQGSVSLLPRLNRCDKVLSIDVLLYSVHNNLIERERERDRER